MRINTRLLVASCLAALLLTDAIVSPRKAGGQSATFKIVGGPFVVSGGSLYWLDGANSPEGWKLIPNVSFSIPPISPSEIAYYDGTRVITNTGEGWVAIFGAGWTDIGPVPTTATRQTTWGQIKDKYRR